MISAIQDCGGRDILSAALACTQRVLISRSPQEKRDPVMPVTENAPRHLVLKSGSTTLTLDKDVGKATLRRKFLMWNLKPAEIPLSEIAQVRIDAAVDRASGVEVFHTMLIMRTGKGWGLPAVNAQDAQTKATAIRAFLGVTA
jgi:hypothetical protein